MSSDHTNSHLVIHTEISSYLHVAPSRQVRRLFILRQLLWRTRMGLLRTCNRVVLSCGRCEHHGAAAVPLLRRLLFLACSLAGGVWSGGAVHVRFAEDAAV